MDQSEDNGKRGYRFAALIYDPIVERWMRPVRQKALEICGMRPGDKVIDVCCGTGRQAEIFAETGARICGVELSDFMFERAKKKEKSNLVFMQADATDTGLAESSFDYASTGFSLHEVDEATRTGFISEMIRVTKPGGYLIFTDFSIQSRTGFKNRLRKAVADFMEWFAGSEHYRNYLEWMESGGLTGFLAGKGLDVENSIHLNGGHILIVKAANIK